MWEKRTHGGKIIEFTIGQWTTLKCIEDNLFFSLQDIVNYYYTKSNNEKKLEISKLLNESWCLNKLTQYQMSDIKTALNFYIANFKSDLHINQTDIRITWKWMWKWTWAIKVSYVQNKPPSHTK